MILLFSRFCTADIPLIVIDSDGADEVVSPFVHFICVQYGGQNSDSKRLCIILKSK